MSSRQIRTVHPGVKRRGSLAGSSLTLTRPRTSCSRHSSQASDHPRSKIHDLRTPIARSCMAHQRPSLVVFASQLDEPIEQHHHHCRFLLHDSIFHSIDLTAQHRRASSYHLSLGQLCHRLKIPSMTWLPSANVLLLAASISLPAAIRALVLRLYVTAKRFFTRASPLCVYPAPGCGSCTGEKTSPARTSSYLSFALRLRGSSCSTSQLATMTCVLSLGSRGVGMVVGVAMRAFISHYHSIAGPHLLPCETAASNTIRTFCARLELMYKRKRVRPPPEPPPTWSLKQAREHCLALHVHCIVRCFASHLSVIAGRHLLWCETIVPNTLRTCRARLGARLGLMCKRRRLRRPDSPPT